MVTVSVGGGLEIDRAGLEALIASLPGLRAVSADANPPPQVLVWAERTTTAEFPPTPTETAILLLTEDTSFESVPEAVTGLFSRHESPTALGIAIRQVARGEQYISPSLAVAILQKQRSNLFIRASQKSALDSLSDREREILDALAEGLSNKAIAARLYLSVRTVEGHLATIYSRLGVHSRTEAMLMAVKSRRAPGLPLHRPQGQV